MNLTIEHRAFERVPIEGQVRVTADGRKVPAVAINLSMGGLLLGAAAPLPVGSSCGLALSLPGRLDGEPVLAEGTVIRSDAKGMAIQFATALDRGRFETLLRRWRIAAGEGWIGSFINYFRVSQNAGYAGCEQLLGVDRATFRKVFLCTFCSIIPIAVLPVWLLRSAIPPGANAVKILLSFAYGLLWLGVIQPVVDLSIFRLQKRRKRQET